MAEPSNFSWIIEGLLAGSGFPSHQSNFEFFKQQGINHVVNLTEHATSPDMVPKEINLVFIPIRDFTPPSVQQINDFIQLVDSAKQKGERVLCHCQWGRGRTGTMFAVYFVKEGLNPAEAIDKVRQMRPYSIETTEQENTVHDFYKYLQNNASTTSSKCK